MTAYVVFGSSLFVAAVTGITTGVVCFQVFDIIRVDQVMKVGFVFGLLAGLAALQVISAAVSAMFVCCLYDETQRVFQANHPEVYRGLQTTMEYATTGEKEEFEYCGGEGCCCPIVICI